MVGHRRCGKEVSAATVEVWSGEGQGLIGQCLVGD